MSGLGAIINLDRATLPREVMKRMENALQIYGPKRQNLSVTDNIGLCWTQLDIFTPEDAYDNQPVIMGSFSLVFDGYLTEREDLANMLGIDTARLDKMPDSKLALKAVMKWGEDAPSKIHGVYSLIITDHAKQTLFAFRVGAHPPPLYYHEKDDRFAIASAPKGLFALGDIPRELNEQRIADSLILNYTDTENCYYRNIKRVPLRHTLFVSRSGKRITKFNDVGDVPNIRFADENEYVEAAAEKLKLAVKSALRSAKPVSAMLSSGMDSSAVVLSILENKGWDQNPQGNSLQTYTHIPGKDWDGRAYGHLRVGDESGPVKLLAEKYPAIKTHFMDSFEVPLDRDLQQLFLAAEAPPRNISNLTWFIDIHRQAKQDGHNVLLGGMSGNYSLSFNGKALYAKLFRQGKWLRLYRELKQADNRGFRYYGFYSRALAPNIPSFITKNIAKIRGNSYQIGWSAYSAINTDYAESMHVQQRADDAGWDDGYSGFSDPKNMMQHMLGHGGRDEANAMYYGLEAMTGVQLRDPLSDRRLVEYCAGLPDEQFLKNGDNRRLVMRMFADKMPNDFLNAPRGRQAADWHVRMTRDLPRYKRQLEMLAQDEKMAKRIDIDRIRKILDSWPDKTPLGEDDHPEYLLAMMGISRALATADYIDWVEGKNR